MNGNKVNNASEYWAEMDFDVSCYIIKWSSNEAKQFLEENTERFIHSYILLANKYGILLPHNVKLDEMTRKDISNLITVDETIYPEDWISFAVNKLYIYNKDLLYSSQLFTQRNNTIRSEKIVNADLLITYKDIISNNNDSIYAEPVKIVFFKNYFYLTFNSDAFFEKIWNKKTNSSIDNSETAYLNTPRFNSFLRDFIILCFQYGATDFEFEKLGYDNISEKGILFGNEIVYYEDIYDLLPEEHKYKPFEEIQVELDNTNYKRYAENKNN